MGTGGKREKRRNKDYVLLEKTTKEIWLLTLYSKSEKATIPGHMLKKIAEEIKNE